MDQDQLKVLQEICKGMNSMTSRNFSFNRLSKDLNIPKEQLDKCLIELDKGGYITEFPLRDSDNLKISLNQLGYDSGQI